MELGDRSYERWRSISVIAFVVIFFGIVAVIASQYHELVSGGDFWFFYLIFLVFCMVAMAILYRVIGTHRIVLHPSRSLRNLPSVYGTMASLLGLLVIALQIIFLLGSESVFWSWAITVYVLGAIGVTLGAWGLAMEETGWSITAFTLSLVVLSSESALLLFTIPGPGIT